MTTAPAAPPMDPRSSEATGRQLELAVGQGRAYRRALDHMAQDVADAGGTQRVGEYLMGYAIEEAEGMYHLPVLHHDHHRDQLSMSPTGQMKPMVDARSR